MPIDNNVLTSKFDVSPQKFRNVCDYVFEYLLRNRERELIIDGNSGRRWTAQKICDSCQSIASALIDEHQLKAGDIVCFNGPNNDLQAIALLAVLAASGVALFIHQNITYDKLQNLYNELNFKYLIIGSSNAENASKLSQNNPQIKKIFITDRNTDDSRPEFINVLKLLETKYDPKGKPLCDRSPSDIALIELTSGTNSGRQNAALKTHSNLISSTLQLQHSDLFTASSDDVIVSLPFDKIFGVSLFLNSLISGSTAVMVSQGFDSDCFAALLEKYGATKLVIVSRDLEMLLNRQVNLKYDIQTIKEILFVGVFKDYYQVRQQVESILKCRSLRAVYGTVETGIVSCVYRSKSYEKNCYSVGQLIAGTRVKVIDVKSGASLSAHRIGEVCVQSDQLTVGYFGDTSKSDIFTANGFFRTADAGYYDNDGQLYIECKVSDLVFGDQIDPILPNEIEIMLASHPDVIDVSVIGVPFESDPENGADGDDSVNNNGDDNGCAADNSFRAFVVLKAGSETSDLDLINYVNDRVEPIKQLDGGVFILDVLPRNCLGAINKSLLISY